ncbi:MULTISPECIES: type II toxin-antitoxin system RelE/ParE family toxin [unclassified Rhizobium]|uniref:type II toxin-antitoxin system RelE/ParE family toxin n=1 Tax=unclassified Rhizobium TaxID=2613769 RepID=UPI000EAA93B9|nr:MULTISPECIES: type II toxin-antitoxin system RelE/ParE family toxin [unclassified Rhizobium]AYG65439.1 type II toxin-antitoxin system RelE/ParE family toxin [Rhizobium sp. CCGE531]AYG71922.1 type II toxin-antitoxin system RelE/ParE family toxin [Rhizobium sp. CCGE532]
MARLRYTADAQSNILDILIYITRQSGSQKVALKFTEQLRRKCANLAALPGQIGRLRPELRDDMRSFAFRGYVIFFHYIDGVFEVLNVLEGHRDFDTHFIEEE